MTELQEFQRSFSTASDPFGQRFRIDIAGNRGSFIMPQKAGEIPSALILAQDIDRGWWGLFEVPRDHLDMDQLVLTEPPVAISANPLPPPEILA